MDDNQAARLLRQAQHEIRHLRRANELLSAQVAVVEVFAAACGLRKEHGGMAPDLVHEIERFLAEPANGAADGNDAA